MAKGIKIVKGGRVHDTGVKFKDVGDNSRGKGKALVTVTTQSQEVSSAFNAFGYKALKIEPER